MPSAKSPEFRRIALIERWLRPRSAKARGIRLGIGDDAAVLHTKDPLIWTVDSQFEGVHFDRRWLSLADVGYRAFQAAASDVAAMGADPLAALSSLALPSGFTDSELERLIKGQAEAAALCECPVIGGNLTKATELSLTTTLVGSAKKPLLRSAAKVGDELWLVGEVGLAAAGLLALQRGVRRGAAIRACIARWQRPRALLDEGRRLRGKARSAIDISDGLAGDAKHLAEASRVRVVFAAEALERALSPVFVAACAALGVEPLSLALQGGEDYALLATGPARRRPSWARPVGCVQAGAGVWLEQHGKRQRVGSSFDHFL